MSRMACLHDLTLSELCSMRSCQGAPRTSSTDSVIALRRQHRRRITDPTEPELIAGSGHRDKHLTTDEVETFLIGLRVFVRIALLAKRVGVEAREEHMLELQALRALVGTNLHV